MFCSLCIYQSELIEEIFWLDSAEALGMTRDRAILALRKMGKYLLIRLYSHGDWFAFSIPREAKILGLDRLKVLR